MREPYVSITDCEKALAHLSDALLEVELNEVQGKLPV